MHCRQLWQLLQLLPALPAVVSCCQLNLNYISISALLRYLIPSARVNTFHLQQGRGISSKRSWVSEWVTDMRRLWSDLGPIKMKKIINKVASPRNPYPALHGPECAALRGQPLRPSWSQVRRPSRSQGVRGQFWDQNFQVWVVFRQTWYLSKNLHSQIFSLKVLHRKSA